MSASAEAGTSDGPDGDATEARAQAAAERDGVLELNVSIPECPYVA